MGSGMVMSRVSQKRRISGRNIRTREIVRLRVFVVSFCWQWWCGFQSWSDAEMLEKGITHLSSVVHCTRCTLYPTHLDHELSTWLSGTQRTKAPVTVPPVPHVLEPGEQAQNLRLVALHSHCRLLVLLSIFSPHFSFYLIHFYYKNDNLG